MSWNGENRKQFMDAYQSWKQQMHIEWPQLGNTILVQVSMQIPHSSSLSISLSETFLLSSTLFLLKTSVHRLLLLVSSNSINWPPSCLSEGYITAAKCSQLKLVQNVCIYPKLWQPLKLDDHWGWTQEKRTHHRIPSGWLSFLVRTLLAFHQHRPVQLGSLIWDFPLK